MYRVFDYQVIILRIKRLCVMNIIANAARETDKLYTGGIMTILTIPIGE